MKYLKFVLILLLFAFFSCSNPSENDSSDVMAEAEAEAEDPGNDEDATTDTEPAIVYNISGKVHKGRCLKDGEVSVQPLIDGSLDQVGNHFTGYTGESGYNIPVEIKEEYSEVFFDGECDDEVNGGSGNYRLSGIVKNSDLIKNINPLTRIRSIVARSIFDEFGAVEPSLIEAERLILNYLSMPSTGRFTEMSLEKSEIQDSVSLIISSAILYGRTGPEQGDYMVTLAEGIIDNDLDLRAGFISVYDQLPIMTIKQNLENSIGSSPPFWQIIAPDLSDLLENDHTIQGSFNLDDNSGCSFDAPGFNMFAIPHIFKSWIETSKYLASNLDGDLSIWTNVIQGYSRPGTKILDIERLSRNMMEGSLQFNGILGDHNLIPDQEYYIVISRESAWRLTTGCDGGLLPFGRKLASKDNGQNWIGHDNNTSWYRKSGIMMYGLD